MRIVKGIVDIRPPTTTTEAQRIIGIFQYYSYMWTRRYHILAPLIEADSSTKSRKIILDDALEESFK